MPPLRVVDGEGDDREVGCRRPGFGQRGADHALPFKEGKDVGGGLVPFRVGRFRDDEGRVRVNDADAQVVAAGQGGERVL